MAERLPWAVAALDDEGLLVFANAAWRRLQRGVDWLGGVSGREGDDPVFLEPAFRERCHEAERVLSSLQNVIQGLQPEYVGEFQVGLPSEPRWFLLRAESLNPKAGVARGVMVTLSETTAQRKAEQDLSESHALFHRIVEGTGDGIFIYDTEGRCLMHNSICSELLAASSSELTGKRIEEIFPPDLAQTIRTQNKLVLDTGRPLGYEIILPTPKGLRTLLVQKKLYLNHRNQAIGVIGISRDITEYKQAEEKIKHSERHYRALIEKSHDCVTILSQEGLIRYVSPQAQRMFGFERDHWIGTNAFFWLHPEDVRLARDRFAELMELPGGTLSVEARVLCKDGSWKWVEATSSNLLHDPSIKAIILNVRDISERKQTGNDLRRFQAIVESSIDGILSVDPEGKITSWNPAAARIFGYSEEEMLGSDFDRLTPEERLKESGDFAHAVLKGKAIKDVETVRVGRGGVRVEVSLTLSPIRDRDGRIAGIACIVRDITEHRRLEKEVLEISDFEKHRIGQDLHDDLCQHLVGISMLGNILYNDLSQYGLKQADDARQITEMIRNAIDHARILARGLSPLNCTHGGLMAGLEQLAANTEQLFRIPCRFECPEAVHIENPEVATHLYRITQEALHNAVKHSRGSQAVIWMERRRNMLELRVVDDGIGPPEPDRCPKSGGLGMHTMAYRARIIGAELSFERNAEGGSSVVCRYPLPENGGE